MEGALVFNKTRYSDDGRDPSRCVGNHRRRTNFDSAQCYRHKGKQPFARGR